MVQPLRVVLLCFAVAALGRASMAEQPKIEYSEAEASDACTRLIQRPQVEAIFARTEVHRDTMGGLGFVCKVFLEAQTADQNIGLSIYVSGNPISAQKFRNGGRLVSGPTTKVEGLGDEAAATVEYQGDRVRGMVIEGVKGAVYFQLWTEPQAMSDALYQQCMTFMMGFVAVLPVN